MTSSSTTTPAFRPWGTDNGEEPALKDILARLSNERGHFREITEASLQEEIAAEGALESSSSDDEDEEQDEDDTKVSKREPPKDRAALYEAKHEMLRHVLQAQHDMKNTLWSIALLQTKYQPSIASVSLSNEIKSMVPVGSLAADVWDPERANPRDPARETQDAILASKIRMRELQDSADGLLAAATRLKENVRQETQFWEEVMSVSDRGWKISRIPGTHHLGVHYGFRGSDPAFARSEIAAITSDSDGNIILERGIGTQPKAVRAIVRRKGQIIGTSRLPSVPDDGETTLEARIRHARDSVFDEELFHELLRESRSLTSMGVTTKGTSVRFDTTIQEDMEVELRLVSLDEDNTLGLDVSNEFDTLAQAILLTARLLLGQEHRNKLNRKQEIPPPFSSKQDDTQQKAAILRPLMLVLDHYAQVQKLNAYLDKMCKLLRIAGASAESQAARLSLPISTEGSIDTQSMVTALMKPLKAEGIIWLIASDAVTLELKLTAEAFVWNTPGSSFTIHTPSGQNVRLFSLEELLIAADDFLALALAQVLKEIVGDRWTLDPREGTLTRTAEDFGKKEVLRFSVDGSSSALILRASGSTGRKEMVWKLDGPSDTKPLNDAWKDLVG